MAYPGKSSSTVRRADSRRTSACIPPCTMPKRDCVCPEDVGPYASGERRRKPHGTSRWCASKYVLQRCAQRKVSSIDSCTWDLFAGYSTHSSKHMMMSAPSAICISMERSGVNRCEEPSRWERKVTPSSVILRSELREKTWNPPESVSIERDQLIKR